MKTKTHRTKYKTTAMVCNYVMKAKKISGRAMAKMLDNHFTTWHRYVRGERRPNAGIKDRLVMMMGANKFIDLVHIAYRKIHPIHY